MISEFSCPGGAREPISPTQLIVDHSRLHNTGTLLYTYTLRRSVIFCNNDVQHVYGKR